MDKSIKLLVVGLIGLLAILGFFTIQINSAKTLAERKVGDLQQENGKLQMKVESSVREIRKLEDKASSLSMDLDRLSREKEDIQRRFDGLNKEREELIDKLKKEMGKQAASVDESSRRPVSATDDAYWGGILKAKADLELQLGNLRNDLKSAQINNEELQRTKASLELEITNLNREKSELQRQAEYNQKMIDSITADIARERNDKFNIAGDLKAIKSENKILRRQLSSLNNRKIELERKLQDVVESKVNLEKDYANMESILKDKVGEVCRLKDRISESVASAADDNTKPAMNKGNSSINLPPIVIRPPADNPVKSSTSGLLGKVLTINKDNNFVVIDLGEDAGVKVGDTFKIYRQDKLVGNVLVIQTRRDISACDIKKEVGSIKIGDTVR